MSGWVASSKSCVLKSVLLSRTEIPLELSNKVLILFIDTVLKT